MDFPLTFIVCNVGALNFKTVMEMIGVYYGTNARIFKVASRTPPPLYESFVQCGGATQKTRET
jgi:hypothetical protein